MAKAIVAGSGVAGLSAALAASEAGFQVTVFETAHEAFYHTSGRNAAIGRSYEADYSLAIPQRKTISFLLEYPQILNPCGLLIRPLEKDYWEEYPHSYLIPQKKTFSFPDGSYFTGEFIQGNGVIHLPNLARYFLNLLEQKKISIYYSAEIKELRVCENFIDCIEVFFFESKEIQKIVLNPTDIFINAAGAWAKKIGQLAGLFLEIIPHKRHLFYLTPPENKKIPKELPVLWDEYYDFYVRPAGEFIMATPGDQTKAEAGDYEVNPTMKEKIYEIFEKHLPFFHDFSIVSTHTCLRSFSRDHRPVIGYDPRLNNFFWNAGWGGHGISLSLGIIPTIKNLLIQGPKKETEKENPFTVNRFL